MQVIVLVLRIVDHYCHLFFLLLRVLLSQRQMLHRSKPLPDFGQELDGLVGELARLFDPVTRVIKLFLYISVVYDQDFAVVALQLHRSVLVVHPEFDLIAIFNFFRQGGDARRHWLLVYHFWNHPAAKSVLDRRGYFRSDRCSLLLSFLFSAPRVFLRLNPSLHLRCLNCRLKAWLRLSLDLDSF